MITATYRDTKVQILKVYDNEAEVKTLDGSTPFKIISSSKAVEHGAPPIAWFTGGRVGIDELTNVRVDGVTAEDYMMKIYDDRVGMETLKMVGEEVMYCEDCW